MAAPSWPQRKKGGMRRPVPCPSGYCAAALRALCDFFFAGLAFFFFLAGALAWAETETRGRLRKRKIKHAKPVAAAVAA